MRSATCLARRAATASVAAGLMVLVAACGGGSSGASADGGGKAAGCAPAQAGEKVTLTFSSWVPGMQKTVDLWNQQNPNIQVKYKEVAGGGDGTYKAYANQIKGGSTGDLGMIEFDSLPSFRLQDGLANIGSCPGISDAISKYVPWAQTQVSFGEKGAVYGIPQDIGPLALYYRKDLFEKAGIQVPTTWDEFYAAAKKIKAKGGYITNFDPAQANLFAGYAWQNGASWFSVDNGGSWKVNLTDPKSQQVASYWQKLLDEKLVDSQPQFNATENKALNNGKQWSLISAAWYAKLLTNGAPDTKGKWTVAPMPQWTPGGKVASNWGGSTTVVFKNSKHPAEAAKFAAWAFGDPSALALNNKNGGQYPASTVGQQQVPALTKPDSFFGGQLIWKQFSTAAGEVNNDWQWGPTMTQTYEDLRNGLSRAVQGSGTISDALKAAQDKTITAMKSQGIQVGA